jgi:hypothetical protein
MIMWSTSLFLVLTLAALAAILYGTPRQVRAIAGLGVPPRFEEMLRRGALVGQLQGAILAAAFAAVGTAFGRQVGLRAPFFEALVAGSEVWALLQAQLVPGLAVGLLAGLVFVGLYYGVFRGWVGLKASEPVERMRLNMGLGTRVLIGGIHEEVVFRWGVMGLAAWAGVKLLGGAVPWVFWTANLSAAALFALYHLPGLFSLARMLQIHIEAPMVYASLILNLFAGLVFGWLFWQVGLLASILAHALFHVIWHPIEKRVLAAGAKSGHSSN